MTCDVCGEETSNEKYINLYGSVSEWGEEDIKSVVTKEQFEQMAYKNEIETLKKENKELVEQLEEYKLQNVSLRADIMIKKMALPNELIKDKTFYDLYDMPTYEELLAQQKEFIDYLGNEININPYDISDYDYEDIINTILSKYKEIIGDIDDKR